MYIDSDGTSLKGFYSSSSWQWKSGSTFLSLLDRYLYFFFPLNELHQEINYVSPQSEMFLWLAVDYWIDAGLVVRNDHDDLSRRFVGVRDVRLQVN